jgi:hypothetical protein
MDKSRNELMADQLRDLQAGTPDIEASAIVSVEGLIMASALPGNVEEDRVSAMSAAMLSLGERISDELARGSVDQVYVKGDKGYWDRGGADSPGPKGSPIRPDTARHEEDRRTDSSTVMSSILYG